jgi:predicted nucleotidyltransferase
MKSSREQILQALTDNLKTVHDRFGVDSLSVFGSIARDSLTSESDVDILVRYHETPGIFSFLDLKQYLEEIVGWPVDLVTEGALKKQLRSKILQEAIRVA